MRNLNLLLIVIFVQITSINAQPTLECGIRWDDTEIDDNGKNIAIDKNGNVYEGTNCFYEEKSGRIY